MGSITVKYKGKQFMAGDASLEVWFSFVIREIQDMCDPPDWLKELRDDWQTQIKGGFDFGIVPNLDKYLISPERCDILVELSERAVNKLFAHSSWYSADQLNAMHIGGPGSDFVEGADTSPFRRVATYFIRLLRGQLTSDQTDARFETS